MFLIGWSAVFEALSFTSVVVGDGGVFVHGCPAGRGAMLSRCSGFWELGGGGVMGRRRFLWGFIGIGSLKLLNGFIVAIFCNRLNVFLYNQESYVALRSPGFIYIRDLIITHSGLERGRRTADF